MHRRRGNDNIFKCTYVLPDGITHTKGFVKDPEQAKRHLELDDNAPSYPAGEDAFDKPEDRKKADLSKNVSLFFLILRLLSICSVGSLTTHDFGRNLA